METTTNAGWPLAYLITFSCYGARLHGDERGSVDRNHNAVGSPFLPAQPARLARERAAMAGAGYVLDAARRDAVLRAMLAVARERGWRVLAAHVRTTHVHAVVTAAREPERVMNDFKTSASKELNLAYPAERAVTRWARHGSTKYLWCDESVQYSVRYVLEGQGEPMSVYDGTAPPGPSEPRTK